MNDFPVVVEVEGAEAPEKLSADQEIILKNILSGKVLLKDARLRETVRDAQELASMIARTEKRIPELQEILERLNNDLHFQRGALRKCERDLIRWGLDPKGFEAPAQEKPAAPSGK